MSVIIRDTTVVQSPTAMSALTLCCLSSTLAQSPPVNPRKQQQTAGVKPPEDKLSSTAQGWSGHQHPEKI